MSAKSMPSRMSQASSMPSRAGLFARPKALVDGNFAAAKRNRIQIHRQHDQLPMLFRQFHPRRFHQPHDQQRARANRLDADEIPFRGIRRRVMVDARADFALMQRLMVIQQHKLIVRRVGFISASG